MRQRRRKEPQSTLVAYKGQRRLCCTPGGCGVVCSQLSICCLGRWDGSGSDGVPRYACRVGDVDVILLPKGCEEIRQSLRKLRGEECDAASRKWAWLANWSYEAGELI